MAVSLDRLALRPDVVLRDARHAYSGPALAGSVAAERRWIRSHGGSRFGLLASNGCPWAIADLALPGQDTPLVPLPCFFTPEQLLHALNDAGVDRVLSDRPQQILDLQAGFAMRDTSPVTGLALLGRTVERPSPLPSGTARITYTSGSTGAPKGVCLRTDTLRSVVESLATALGPASGGPHLALLPLSTLLENVAGLYLGLARGSRCELRALDCLGMHDDGLDPDDLCRALDGIQPATLILVPEILRALVAAAGAGWRPPRTLRFVAVGGAVLSPDLLAQATAAGLPVFEGYGLSECASVVSLNLPGASRPGSVGRPLPHAQVRIAADGEILVRGAVHSGYLGGPPAEGAWATGDLGHVDGEGYLYVHGRRRNLIITAMGRNICPEWVEGELLGEAEIAAAVVAGEGRPALAALLSPAWPGADLDAAVARANARLPAYARIRHHAVLPRPLTKSGPLLTANGRLRRALVLDEYAALIDGLYRTNPGFSTSRMDAQHELL